MAKLQKRARRHSPERRSASASSSSSSAVVPYTGDDRLSDLPVQLRYHILTLLPLKYAVRTTALNKGWRGNWKKRWPQSACLNFVRPPTLTHSQFIAHINHFLGDRPTDHRLDVVRLVFYPGLKHLPLVKLWLDRATDCGVELLLLDFTPPPPLPPPPPKSQPRRGRPPKNEPRPFPLTSFCFSSGGPSLTHLAFDCLHLTAPPRDHFRKLTSLETLRLYNVVLTDTTLRRITSELPRLRKLDIRGCPDLRRTAIHGQSITKIIIVACHNITKLNVFSQTLRSIHFSSVIVNAYNITNPAPLEDVFLSCGGPGTPALMDGNWVGALGPLSRVRVLTLCSIALQYIAISGGRMNGVFRVLESVQELQLLMMMMADGNLNDIYSFFRLCRCPRLEKLFIVLPSYMRDSAMKMFLDAGEVAPPEKCFENLRMIKISNFKGHTNEMRLLRFLLATAAHLETLVIIAPLEHLGDDYSQNIFHKIQDLDMQFESMTKASPNLQTFVYARDDNKIRPTHRGYCDM